jgi:GT2 family glycosyltransferase
MRIGCGITTFNRPECLKECLEHINKHTFMDNITLYVATDTDEDRRGVAYRKNECLKYLKDYRCYRLLHFLGRILEVLAQRQRRRLGVSKTFYLKTY